MTSDDFGTDDAPAIRRLRAPATYELVADQLRRALALGRFVAGDKLPPERDLAQQLGVSRTSVREAIRVLEGEGVVAVRRGVTGGISICDAPVTQPQTYEQLRAQAESYNEILEFRLANECAATRLAARRRTKQEITQLWRLMTKLDDNARGFTETDDEEVTTRLSTGFMRLDTQLHLAIARAGKNSYLLKAVESGRVDMMRLIGGIFTRPLGDVHHGHREIVEAIAAGDETAATAAMADHLESTREQLRAQIAAHPDQPQESPGD